MRRRRSNWQLSMSRRMSSSHGRNELRRQVPVHHLGDEAIEAVEHDLEFD